MVKKITVLVILLIFASILTGTGCARPLYRKEFVVLGTYLEVLSDDKAAAGIVYEEFKRLDKIFSLYGPASELSRLNKTYNEPFRASAELIEVLGLSREVYDLSQGAFDVTQGALYKFWKKLINEGEVENFPAPETVAKIKELGGVDNIKVDSATGAITVKKKGLIIDLSAVAKGYIVDKAIVKLKQAGIKSALINAGGDIYCLGRQFERPWEVGIKDPRRLSEILETQSLIDEAVATSGGYEQFFTFKGKKYSHLVDPRSGYPVDNDLISVSVISENCATADSLATAFSILGLEAIEKFLSKNPSTMRVFLVRSVGEDKKIHIFN